MQKKIENYIKSLGLDCFGFIKCRTFHELKDFYERRTLLGLKNEFEEDDINLRISPNHYMEKGKTIISIAFPYHHLSEYDNGFSIYTRGLDYHTVLNRYLNEICKYIESLGGKAKSFVDSNTLPERYIAYLAGVGFIGRNNLLITERYGSYVFLGEIITDLEIYSEDNGTLETLQEFNECGDCSLCYNHCPTKAINKNRKNSNICLSYITQKKELEDWEINALKGRVFGCDTCQLACIKNIGKENLGLRDFIPLEFMKNSSLENDINIDNKSFKEKYKITSCGWRGKNIIIRNLAIRKKMYLGEDLGDIRSESPYIKKYLDRLLK